ncbi:putative bifunctional diguanylate cyclase/phosphodiesterase [Kineosporia succinea]|uniref:Diguanylate cyclase (GGDEF)-like protein n=1 Tax=Kineosporia succinea TaxID=84632 RepID=A0ABT9PC96_9ACTN|nr:bifunctional diguanylate cyclase/phosphodiesterase [Kineosporia succinea]MDP9830024.1 diguanylate cyclase (GGDEF)-like protein [Kineosporia succinea]
MRAVRTVCAAVVATLLAYCVLVALSEAGRVSLGSFALVVLPQGVFAGSALVCGLRAALVPGDRLAWAFFSAGLGSYSLGTLLWQLVYEPRADTPYPSLSDGLWLGLAPLSMIGIWLMVRARLGRRVSLLLDGLVAGLGVASVAALIFFPTIERAATQGTLAEIVTNFAYPLVDLGLAAAAVGAMVALAAWRQPAWVMLAAGFLVFAVADTWYLLLLVDGTFYHGGWNDASYLVADAFIALAAVRPTAVEPQQPRVRGREFLIPVLSGLPPVAVLALGSLASAPLAVVLALASLTALAVRTALAMREVVALSDQRRLARTDSLTGLPNRRALYDLLEEGTESGSVMIIDLDRFKEINDALGHQVGDELLRQVAARFSDRVPGTGVIARLGGDEFAIYLPGASRDEAARVAADLTAALEEPFTITGTLLHVGASMGITAIAAGTQVGRALAEADMAMYRAKTARSGFEVYDDTQHSSAWDRLATVEALRLALDRGRLTLAFQPIVDAHTRLPRSVEALVRWTDAERGFVPPDVFLPLAEHAGLMPQLTRTVLDLAFEEAAILRELGHDIAVSVNLSASDLLDGLLEQELLERLHEHALPVHAVKIEITESLLVDSHGRAGDFLLAVREEGFELLVDDFGTGYSSMAYLHDLPVSTLKIDRAFTSRLSTDPRTGVIVDSTIEMAHRLGLSVVAEGVETEAELAWLQEHHCDLIQGYLMSRPLPAADLHTWLAAQKPLSV